MTPTRRLAAIMAADVAGFSAAMERDEEGTFAQVQELRRKIIEPEITEQTSDGFRGKENSMSNESLKQELQQINNAYAASYNSRDAAGIAALFVNGGVHVNEAGPRTDIELFYQTAFKAGSS